MIRELRARHRIWASILLIAGPTAVAISAASRPQPVRQVHESGARGGGFPVRVGIDSGPNGQIIRIRATAPLEMPDPLLYWSLRPADSTIPPDAVLLGAIDGPVSGSPAAVAALARPGQLIIWSNGYRRLGGQAPYVPGQANR